MPLFSVSSRIWTTCATRFARVSFRLEAGSRDCVRRRCPAVNMQREKKTTGDDAPCCPPFFRPESHRLKPTRKGCEDCLKKLSGDTWNEAAGMPYLRPRSRPCCDDSKNHMRTQAHFPSKRHALIRSYTGWASIGPGVYADKACTSSECRPLTRAHTVVVPGPFGFVLLNVGPTSLASRKPVSLVEGRPAPCFGSNQRRRASMMGVGPITANTVGSPPTAAMPCDTLAHQGR